MVGWWNRLYFGYFQCDKGYLAKSLGKPETLIYLQDGVEQSSYRPHTGRRHGVWGETRRDGDGT